MEWLTVDEVAQRLRVSKAAVYRAVKRGDIASKRIGRFLRIPRFALERPAVQQDIVIAALSKALGDAVFDAETIGEAIQEGLNRRLDESR